MNYTNFSPEPNYIIYCIILSRVQKLKLMEVLTQSPLQTIYPPHTIGFVMFCMIWYNLHNLKNVKTIHRGVLLSVNLQAKSLYLYQKQYSSKGVFHVFKLYKWYQIAQNITSEFAINTWELKNSWEQLFWGNLRSMVT